MFGVCVRVKGSGLHKGRQEESGAGSWVKGAAEPGRAQGEWGGRSGGAQFSREAWEAKGWGGLVLMETSKVTKTDLTGRLNEAAGTERSCSSS